MKRIMMCLLTVLLIGLQLPAQAKGHAKPQAKAENPYKKKIQTGPFKFNMEFPVGVEFTDYIDGKWGGLTGSHEGTDTLIACYAYKGKAKKVQVYQYAVKKTDIAAKRWEKMDVYKNTRGFAYAEKFKTEIPHPAKPLVFYTIIAKNQYHDIHYVFFLLAPKKSFEKHQKGYMAWLDSLQGLK